MAPYLYLCAADTTLFGLPLTNLYSSPFAGHVFHLNGVIPGLFPTLYAGNQTGLQQITSCAFANMTDDAELLFLDCFWVLIQQIAILGYLYHITRLLFPATDAQMYPSIPFGQGSFGGYGGNMGLSESPA